MESYYFFRDLALIIFIAKVFGVIVRKMKAPAVVGEIVAGLIIGPSVLGWVQQTDFIMQMAEIGVVLLMFSAGLETNLKDLKKTGPVSLLIAVLGVVVPLLGGSLLYFAFYGMAPWGSDSFYQGIFLGVIITATSVSITVETLKEMGKLKGELGTTILNAAIVDDVIGIIVLTFIVGIRNPDSSPSKVLLSTGLFFIFAFVAGYLLFLIFRFMDNRYPHTRRITIAGLSLCLAFAYIAERYFGIADITGAYVAGIILCSIKDSEYIAEKMDTNSYLFFGPIFFASIGLMTNLENMTGNLFLFSVIFVIVALLTKIIGCGIIAKLCKFSTSDSLKIGVGMMSRGEVSLIMAQKGLEVGLLQPIYFTSVILLIIISSIITPITLKLLFARDKIISNNNITSNKKGIIDDTKS